MAGKKYQNGRYENQVGFLVLTQTPITVQTLAVVKMGTNQSKIKFEVQYIDPLHHNTWPCQSVQPSTPGPIIKENGRCVIIIGPDIYGRSTEIGNYGIVYASPQLPEDIGFVYFFFKKEASRYGYYQADSICGSDSFSVEWNGQTVLGDYNNDSRP